ncbi:GTPase HflX [Natribacillus halophilus]|uniref:GTPase HflX n=1 Tax=Natribacillus halophilus TaxID=549003 RepID=UPI001FE11AC0|nr:GTPase HflX [Natribacillus halophilus]
MIVTAVIDERERETDARASLAELKSLVTTAGGTVMATATQNRPAPDVSTYVGKGKAEEIQTLVEEWEADVVVVNGELSPRQGQSLTARTTARVIDRTQLILDIFADRARTKEGRIQVELAQLTYLLPRLRGQGESLSRLGAGIGTRGPGETKLETDRRHIRGRMDELKKDLRRIRKHRSTIREQKDRLNQPQFTLVGYTNSGKTTLLNALTNEDALAEDLLFATLDPLTRGLRLPSGLSARVSDTVGFIRGLPTTLIAAFRATLEEVTDADILIHVIDATSPEAESEKQTVLQLLNELGAGEIPVITVMNKAETLDEGTVPIVNVDRPWLYVSAKEHHHIGDLHRVMEDELSKQMAFYAIHIPASNGRLLHTIRQTTLVQSETFDEEKEMYKLEGYAFEGHPQVERLKKEGQEP